MTQTVRQSKLFAAEDYTAVYDSYINANFQAYDYTTIRATMVEYVQDKYPENFNDWVESSEFVALLDLIAQFGHNLAFRADLNTRNNFLSTAQRQDSVFKLAEFLGYQPRRNVPAFGNLKVTTVKTNETVIGSTGTTLAGKEIRYESTSDINNLDDFITVMNAVFVSGNQFGTPRINTKVDGHPIHYYNLNTLASQVKFAIQGSAGGSSASFDVIGLDYNTTSRNIIETAPNPDNAFTMIYKNDGKGVSSNNSGFFVGFKQGTLQYKDFTIDTPISNLTLDIDVTDINNSDVWVQSIDSLGNVTTQWTKVDSIHGQNEVFNSIPNDDRNIFAVKTRLNNQVSILFSDENFGNVPKNLIRVWYRTSQDATYTLRPDDISTKSITLQYVGADGNTYSAIFGLQLKSSLSNATKAESLDTIKTNAPRSYSTQDRMITADDYNNFLLNQSEQIMKIKSINRTHSGHSRYAKLYDPTGSYSNLHLFGTDGTLTKKSAIKTEHTDNINASSVFENFIKPAIANHELLNKYYSQKSEFEALRSTMVTDSEEVDFTWQTNDKTTGHFANSTSGIKSVGSLQSTYLKYITIGALLKFSTPITPLNDVSTVYWARVSSIFADGRGIDDNLGAASGLTVQGKGAITLDIEVPDGTILDMIYPALAKQFTNTERLDIISRLSQSQAFTISYDYKNNVNNTKWAINDSTLTPFITVTPTLVNASASAYTITTHTERYTIETDQIEFTNLNNEYNINEFTNKKNRDLIVLHDTSTDTKVTFYAYGYTIDANGLYESNKVILALVDSSTDARADNPDAYYDIANTADTKHDLRYEWTHIPANNEIVDPSLSNIIDVFALTRDYHTKFNAWLKDSSLTYAPLPATIDELNRQFTSVDSKKAMSDTVVYRPVKYKVLFGKNADAELRARFSIVKVPGSNLTDNDIKSKTIEAINTFFDITNWDFGETFYFTELAAYVHNELIGTISSFVINPESSTGVFGSLFQITPLTDELFIPDATATDIDIVTHITVTNNKA